MVPERDDPTRYSIDLADSTMNFVGAELGDRRHRRLLSEVADARISGDAAVAEVAALHGLSIDRSRGAAVSGFDDYLLPSTFTLRSRITDAGHPEGITDAELLRTVEVQLSHLRAAEIGRVPVPGRLDYDHMKAIHRHLFQDIYHWAGVERVGPETAMIRFAPDAIDYEPFDPAAPMVKYTYLPGPEIAEAASIQYSQLELLLHRRGLTREAYLDLVPEFSSELIAIHSFRDGNMRAQWVFAIYYNDAIGFPEDLGLLAQDTSINRRISHSLHRYQATGDHSGMLPHFLDFTAAERTPRV